MAGTVDTRELEKFANNLNNLDMGEVLIEAVKELSMSLLAKTKKKTPVSKSTANMTLLDFSETYKVNRGQFKKGDARMKKAGRATGVSFSSGGKNVSFVARNSNHVPGTLRDGWFVSDVERKGSFYQCHVQNDVNYAVYIEYGHRTRNHASWVQGRFMLTFSVQEVEKQMERVVQRKIAEAWEGLFR